MDALELDPAKFQRRLHTFVSNWPANFDAVLILKGERNDDAKDVKSTALHQWLFGMEFPESVVVVDKSGKMVIFAGDKKLKYLEPIRSADVVMIARTKGKDLDQAQVEPLEAVVRANRGSSSQVALGVLLKEKHVGSFAESMLNAFKNFGGFSLVECRDEISELLAPKDEEELEKTKNAATFAVELMSQFIQKVELVVDGDLNVTNASICKELDDLMESQPFRDKMEKEKPGLDVDEVDLPSCALQSGGTFDLSLSMEPTDETVPMQGTYLLSIGAKYAEYSAFVARTLLVDPKPAQKVAYLLAVEVQSAVVSSLKPGAIFRDSYAAAVNLVREKNRELADKFVKSVGWTLGLELRDPQMTLTENCTRVIKPGMVFCVSVGFTEQGPPPAKAWGVWLCDTVVVPEQGGESPKLFTAGAPKLLSDIMYELGAEEGAPPEPANEDGRPAAAPAQAAPPQVAPTPQVAPPQKKTPPVADPQPSGPAVPVTRPTAPTVPEPKAKAKGRPKGKAKAAPEPRREAPPPARTQVEPPARATRQQPTRGSTQEASKQAPMTRAQRRGADDGPARGTRTSARAMNQQAKQNMVDLAALEDKQKQLREKKLLELQKRFLGPDAEVARGQVEAKKLYEYQAYKSADEMPEGLKANRVHLDMDMDALLVPVAGAVVPFHARTIKNITRSTLENRIECLRVNFFVPGQGKAQEDFPMVNGKRVYVKELTFKSLSASNFERIVFNFKELGKKMKQKDLEGEVRKTTTVPEGTKLELIRGYPCLRDLNMRPTWGHGARRTLGTLEAHANGFRFSLKGSSEKLEVFYSQVAHAIFEPSEKQSLIVVLHLHLKEPMMLGKKKTQDIQFFTEVTNLTEDLGQMKAGSAHDPDEILSEQREREMKEKLNKVFKDFAEKVEKIQGCPFRFDIPFQEMSFSGVPYKAGVQLVPCAHCLVGLQEWPPFCLSIHDVDIVVFERAANLGLREFDMVFVKKNFDEMPVRITMIPKLHLDMMKRWLANLGIVWYTIGLNMHWPMVMKDITKDLKSFVKNGGWDPWFALDGNDSSEDADHESESDFEDAGSDDDDGSPDEDESDFEDDMDDEEDSSADVGSKEDEGMDWDELERKAEKDDRKTDAENRKRGGEPAAKSRPAKRPRR